MISQDKAVVEQYVRRDDNNWIYKATIGSGGSINFESVETEVSLNEIYDFIEFEEENL